MNKVRLLIIAVVGWLGVMMTNETVASEFVPPNDGYDWLRLTSGEWLRGELIGVFNDEVEFDSDILDELTIDGEDVDRDGVFENINVGTPIIVVGTIHGNRHKMGENPMTVDVTDLTPPTNCGAMFTGSDSATFTFHTAQIPPSAADLTFVAPAIGVIPGTIIDQEESFALIFDDGAIADPDGLDDCNAEDWFPGMGDTTCFEGDTITWSQNQSPTDAACNAEVQNQSWRIGITGE